ncbi:MAG: TIGR04290 family methyltransferase [Acidobacteriota bacterium]|nr:TIGR04290 family methyltransferase [Acidobacteriota bacterium]
MTEIEKRVNELGPWFHNIVLQGVQTAPNHFLGDYPSAKWRNFEHAIPPDLAGMSVLDIGCNGGFYSIEMKRRGAERVLGIDHDEQYLEQARYAAQVVGMDISFERMSVYEVGKLQERFDLVIFMGVLYHLRHPLLALDLIRQNVAKDWFVFQSMLRGSRSVPRVEQDYPFWEAAVFDKPGFPKMHFIENQYSEDPTNWWIPNRACAEALLRSAGFRIESSPEEEVFICRCDTEAHLHELPELAKD